MHVDDYGLHQQRWLVVSATQIYLNNAKWCLLEFVSFLGQQLVQSLDPTCSVVINMYRTWQHTKQIGVTSHSIAEDSMFFLESAIIRQR